MKTIQKTVRLVFSRQVLAINIIISSNNSKLNPEAGTLKEAISNIDKIVTLTTNIKDMREMSSKSSILKVNEVW